MNTININTKDFIIENQNCKIIINVEDVNLKILGNVNIYDFNKNKNLNLNIEIEKNSIFSANK